MGLLEETKWGGGEEKNDREWIIMKYITYCVGTRYNEMHWKLVNNYRVGGKGKNNSGGG
jgi:hypothetical protein